MELSAHRSEVSHRFRESDFVKNLGGVSTHSRDLAHTDDVIPELKFTQLVHVRLRDLPKQPNWFCKRGPNQTQENQKTRSHRIGQSQLAESR